MTTTKTSVATSNFILPEPASNFQYSSSYKTTASDRGVLFTRKTDHFATISALNAKPMEPEIREGNVTLATSQATARPAPKKNKILLYSIYALFFSLFTMFIPYVISKSLTVWSFIGSFLLFNTFVPVISGIVDKMEFSQQLPDRKKVEVVNRIISIIFNLSVSLHSWDLYLSLDLLGAGDRHRVMEGSAWVLDFFSGWSIGYILYDFIYLVSVYGESSYAILLHHCGEMLIVSSYIYNPPLGGSYTLGGALMLVSSAMLHVQRICFLVKVPRNILIAIKVVLLATWIGGRLFAAPHMMYLAYLSLPLDLLHCALIFTGFALFSMNIMWGFKIARKNDLGF